jgi:hypothetical protein
MKTFESAGAFPPEPNGCGIAAADAAGPVVFWHRELSPVEAVVLGEHIVEATSERMPFARCAKGDSGFFALSFTLPSGRFRGRDHSRRGSLRMVGVS